MGKKEKRRKTMRLKKLIGVIAAVAIAGYIAKVALTANTANVDVVMTIESISITNILPLQITVGAPPGGKRVTTRQNDFVNNGSVNEDFSIKVGSTTPSTWSLVSTTPGTDQYRLSALWHEYNTLATNGTTEFQANDILTSSNQLSSDTVFFNDSETHATTNVKGYNVPVFGNNSANERSLFFMFEAPSSTTTANTATATVNVTAAATP
jgi:hypothetical protein